MKNELNLFTYGYYPGTPLQNIKQFFRNIKFCFQRCIKGYCDKDVWDMDVYLTYLLRDMLNDLSETSHGWPESDKFPTYESWANYLKEIAVHFNNSIESEDNCKDELLAYDNYSEYIKNKVDLSEDEEEKRLKEIWLNKSIKEAKYREKEQKKALKMLIEVFNSLWD